MTKVITESEVEQVALDIHDSILSKLMLGK